MANVYKYYLSVIRNEKVGCSIHLSGTRYKKAQFARLGFLFVERGECFANLPDGLF